MAFDVEVIVNELLMVVVADDCLEVLVPFIEVDGTEVLVPL